MTTTIDAAACGAAALSILEKLTAALCERGIIAGPALSSALEESAKMLAARGVATNCDIDSGAARLVSAFAHELERRVTAGR